MSLADWLVAADSSKQCRKTSDGGLFLDTLGELEGTDSSTLYHKSFFLNHGLPSPLCNSMHSFLTHLLSVWGKIYFTSVLHFLFFFSTQPSLSLCLSLSSVLCPLLLS